ncbi:hypothetical protein GCM10023093_15330 [Nemorincola caseinilytica]|uniref:DUF3857 domain-containing protein n=1 Tax=Nemorincola caseinilytica TaxID=2054315 RepID=A0ABP8NEI8_9BACT
MKRPLVFITILFSALALTVSAQKKLYLSQNPIWVEWADTARPHPVPLEHATEPAVMLLNEVKIDYRVEGGNIVKHTTKHGLIKVLDDRGIARYSLIPVKLNRGTKVPTIKARTISQNGKVWNFDQKRTFYSIDSDKYILWLPMEGLDENTEIEYLVKEVNSCDDFGTDVFQFDVPVDKTHFLLSYPKNMVVEGRSYNGLPELRPEQAGSRMQYKLVMNDIPSLLPEKNSYYDLHTMQFSHRVSYYTPNDGEEKIKLNTWNNLARKLYDENYKISEREDRAVNRFLADLGVRTNDDEEKNIRKIELGIKKNITLYPYVDYEERREITSAKEQRSMSVYAVGYEDPREVLDTIISKGVASYKGYIRLFAACLTQAGIKHEIGWAWDRSSNIVNTGFESWEGLEHTLIYFPRQKKFLSPTEQYLRYPVIPPQYAGSKGVFCVMPNKGENTGPMHKVRRITPLPENETRNDVTASVSFTKNMDAKANVSRAWYGYESVGLRSELPEVRPENMKKFVAEQFDFVRNYNDIKTYDLSNDDVSNYNTNKPLVLTATIDASDLVNKAGSRYLIKAGKLINTQNDMYEERARETAVEVPYPYTNKHTITINIPKGYKILNPEAARMSADYLNGDVETVISFESNYRLIKDNKNGDKLVITVNEMYKQLHFPVLQYDRFRKVWNTAADFNNLTLVLAKK